MGSFKNLESLSLRDMDYGLDSYIRSYLSLEEASSLRCLDLSYNDVSEEKFILLLETIRDLSLESLNLSHIRFGR